MEIAVNALVAQLDSQAAIEPSVSGALASPATAPDELASARFAALMQAPEVSQPVPVHPGSMHSDAVRSSAAPQSLGDRLLASLQTASGNYKSSFEEVQSALKSNQSMEMREMMAMQLQITQMSVQYELLGKVVSRSTQNVDQLVRVQ